jgi:hypothetical protein
MAERETFDRRGIANVIINVSDIEFTHGNGLSGQHIIRARKEGEQFGILVVYPTPEIQDIGDERKTVHWLKATPLARDICGMRSEDGQYTRMGVLLCAAEPDLSRDLEKAIEEEMEFLNDNIPEVKYKKTKEGAMVAYNVETDDVRDRKIKLSRTVQQERIKFEKLCRSLVTKEEVERARKNMLATAAKLVSDGDTLWAAGGDNHKNISELVKWACRLLGLERPWCYVAVAQFPCPGCGKPCRENVITCGSCGAVFSFEIVEYSKMTNREKALSLYPDRFVEPEPAGAKK